MEKNMTSAAYAQSWSSGIAVASFCPQNAVVVTAPTSPRLRGELCPLTGMTPVGGTTLASGSGSTPASGISATSSAVVIADEPQSVAVLAMDVDHRSTDRKFAFVKYQPGSRSLRPPV